MKAMVMRVHNSSKQIGLNKIDHNLIPIVKLLIPKSDISITDRIIKSE